MVTNPDLTLMKDEKENDTPSHRIIKAGETFKPFIQPPPPGHGKFRALIELKSLRVLEPRVLKWPNVSLTAPCCYLSTAKTSVGLESQQYEMPATLKSWNGSREQTGNGRRITSTSSRLGSSGLMVARYWVPTGLPRIVSPASDRPPSISTPRQRRRSRSVSRGWRRSVSRPSRRTTKKRT